MLITFKSKAHANIMMFGDVGEKLLEMMDFGKTVPGAINQEDVDTALKNLEKALSKMPQAVEPTDDSEEDQPPVSLHTRAGPLLELLRATVKDETYLRWE